MCKLKKRTGFGEAVHGTPNYNGHVFPFCLLTIVVVMNILLTKENVSVLNQIEFNKTYKRLPYYPHNISYVTLMIGSQNITKHGRVRNCIRSLERTAPGAKLVILTNNYTYVEQSLIDDYNIWVSIEHTLINLTPDDVKKLYPFPRNFWTWFGVYRYKFYVDYLEFHKEYEYVLFMDADSLVLKNPIDIINKDNSNIVHMMNDYWRYNVTEDWNFRWFRDYYNFMNKSTKRKECKVEKLEFSLNSYEFLKEYPINAGLMLGKSVEILKLCRFLTNISLCIGMFQGSCEQSMINYLYYNGMINKTGVIIRAHHMNEGEIMSCPEWCSEKELNQSEKWTFVHHYNKVKKRHLLSKRILDIIS